MIVRYDCCFYLGEKPCRFKRTCEGCDHYKPQGTRVLIIKLGAMGDCLRTTPLLRALDKLHQPLHVSWITDPASYPLLLHNPLIDRLLTLDLEAVLRLDVERFDLAYCFDKDPRAIAAMMRCRAQRKFGFGMTEHGSLCALNPESEYALRLGLDDPLKFEHNRKTYQQITFEMADMEFNAEPYLLELTDAEHSLAEQKLAKLGIASNERLIGLNTGAGAVFATKRWPVEHWIELGQMLSRAGHGRLLLLGGPEEVQRNAAIGEALGDAVVDTGTDNPLRVFAAIVSRLGLLVSADTLAMHLGLAQGVPCVALFGSTTPHEVECYGLCEKLVSDADCAPCYRSSCEDMRCMEGITPATVFAACKRVLAVD
ncbi:MAG: glycosyltransferase family 9 protein [Candidatus Alcyoniella australis]|nr:glycosyltransferase family 9 protein [Candidatus Alcyoniella australis]